MSRPGIRTTLAGVALAAGGLLAAPASAQTVMKMAGATINDVQHEWLRRFDAAIKPRLGDKQK